MLTGVFVNSAAVALGGSVGFLLKKGIPESVKTLIMQGLSLGVLYVGLSGVPKGHNTVFIIVSLTLGAMIGQLMDLDSKINHLGDSLQGRLNAGSNLSIVEGFTNCTLFVCPGAMAIVGSLESGLTGGYEVLFAKALIDLIFAIVMASTLGIGVSLASVSVFLYEAALTIGASLLSAFLTDIVIDEMACVGSILVIALGLNMLGVTKIKLANLIPAPFIPILLYAFFH